MSSIETCELVNNVQHERFPTLNEVPDPLALAVSALQKLKDEGLPTLIPVVQEVVHDLPLPQTSEPISLAPAAPTVTDIAATPSIRNIPAKHERPAKRQNTRKVGKNLSFRFKVDTQHFYRRYSPKKFSELTPTQKTLLAIGQSGSFTQSSASQEGFIERVVNKGAPDNARITKEELNLLIEQAINDGLATKKEERVTLAATAFDILTPPKIKESIEVEAPAPPDQTDKEFVSILPNFEMSKEVEDAMINLGYAQLEVLAELEINNGSIISKKPYAEISELIDSDAVDSKTYKKSIDKLVQKGILTVSEPDENKLQTITLTENGIILIGYLKAHPDSLPKPLAETFKMGTGFRIVELIAVMTDYTPGKWMYGENREVPILPELCDKLGISEDALIRRLFDLRIDKKFIIAAYDAGENQSITNLMLTKEGLDFYEKGIACILEKEKLVDDESAWELDAMTQTCVELATELGRISDVENLQKQRDEKHVCEMTQREFKQEFERITKLLKDLRYDYVFEFGKT